MERATRFTYVEAEEFRLKNPETIAEATGAEDVADVVNTLINALADAGLITIGAG